MADSSEICSIGGSMCKLSLTHSTRINSRTPEKNNVKRRQPRKTHSLTNIQDSNASKEEAIKKLIYIAKAFLFYKLNLFLKNFIEVTGISHHLTQDTITNRTMRKREQIACPPGSSWPYGR